MSAFDDPAPSRMAIGAQISCFFGAMFHVRYVTASDDDVVSRLTFISSISAEVGLNGFGAAHDDRVKCGWQQFHVMPVGSADDER